MPSADFCTAVRSPCGDLSPDSGTQHRSPEVRSTAFAARPPDLPPRPLMAVDFAISSSLVRPGRPLYPVLVHRAAALLHASFRPRLATTPLRFANPSPPSGWIEDFHLQAVDRARHTTGYPAFAGSDGCWVALWQQLTPGIMGSLRSKLCEKSNAPRMRRIIFSIALSRKRLQVQLSFTSPKSRQNFYAQVER
jgi:hypothetical protein